MTEPEIHFDERLSGRNPARIALLVGGLLAVIVGAAVTMGASPSAPPTPDPGVTATPAASADPGAPGGPWKGDGRGFFDGRGRFGGAGIGAITITAISGSNLTLETEDGWTRTIGVTSTTTITKGGETIAVGDLAVGDSIRFRQSRGTDGSFTVTEVRVLLPAVVGTITATSATTITIERPDGTSTTVTVDADTTYEVAGVTNADLGDVAVGMRIVAVGEQNADGSLDASAVHVGTGRFRDRVWDHDKPGRPGPSASPDSSSSAG